MGGGVTIHTPAYIARVTPRALHKSEGRQLRARFENEIKFVISFPLEIDDVSHTFIHSFHLENRITRAHVHGSLYNNPL